MTRTAAAVLAVPAGGLLPAGALASPTMHVKPKKVHAGKKVRVFGNAAGCQAGDPVTLISRAFPKKHEFAGVPAVFAAVHADGSYSKRVRIPRSKAPKRYTISGRCGGGNLGVSRKLRALAARARGAAGGGGGPPRRTLFRLATSRGFERAVARVPGGRERAWRSA